mmetsp:Transcript_98838/g.255466  ORF Transcript_98838/g.255466 Transcript_98838/m.255466 type:complete len:376 (+) Transcript_98838:82-1209(+)
MARAALLVSAAQLMALSAVLAAAQETPLEECAQGGSCASVEVDDSALMQRLHVNRLESYTSSAHDPAAGQEVLDDGLVAPDEPLPSPEELAAAGIRLVPLTIPNGTVGVAYPYGPYDPVQPSQQPSAICGPGCGHAGDTKCPLVVALHGMGDPTGQTMQRLLFGYGANMFDVGSFCIIFPMSTDGVSWNLNTGGQGSPDFDLVLKIAETGIAQLNIDLAAVFLVGYSNGGSFGYTLMCSRTTPFVAFAAIEAQPVYIYISFKGKQCCPNTNFNLMAVQGSLDSAMPPDRITNPAMCATAPEIVQNIARANSCGRSLQVPNGSPNTQITEYTSGCRQAGSASLYMIEGGTHSSVLTPGLWQEIWQYFTKVVPTVGR